MKPKINIFQQYYYAVLKPQKYSELARLGGGRLFLFTLFLALIITLAYVAPSISYFVKHNGINGLLKEYIPDYTYKDGSLQLDYTYNGYVDSKGFQLIVPEDSKDSEIYLEKIKPFLAYYIFRSMISDDEINAQDPINTDFYLYINTDINSVNDINFDELDITATEGLFVTKTDCILYPFSYYTASNTSINEAYQKQELEIESFTDIWGNKEYSKNAFTSELQKYTPIFYITACLSSIFVALFSLGKWYFAALIFSIFALILNSLLHKNLSYGTLYKISVYAQITTITLVAVNTVFSLVNEGIFIWIGRLITAAYIFAALHIIKGNTVIYSTPEQPYQSGQDYNDPQ